MLILHIHITGKKGNIERTYDFMRNDGHEHLEGCDIVIPYKEEYHYPMSEAEAIGIIQYKDLRGNH